MCSILRCKHKAKLSSNYLHIISKDFFFSLKFRIKYIHRLWSWSQISKIVFQFFNTTTGLAIITILILLNLLFNSNHYRGKTSNLRLRIKTRNIVDGGACFIYMLPYNIYFNGVMVCVILFYISLGEHCSKAALFMKENMLF